MLFLKVKDTNFESNSQQSRRRISTAIAVSESQRYKFWKQFTTISHKLITSVWLFLKVKDTNFESNSQPNCSRVKNRMCCFWKSKIQILKAIHNTYSVNNEFDTAVSESQRYKFWKQFTTITPPPAKISGCFWKSKIQILKAIHNLKEVGIAHMTKQAEKSKMLLFLHLETFVMLLVLLSFSKKEVG